MFPVTLKSMLDSVRWLGHAGLMTRGRRVVYVDPYALAFPDVGDAILITDDQPQHCSPDEAKWLRKGATVIVVPPSCEARFKGDVRVVKPGDALSISGVSIEVMPAYNPDVGEKSDSGRVGFVITIPEGIRLYHAGATGLFPEMAQIRCDVALLPIGGGNGMDATRGAQAADLIQPKLAIPIEWGSSASARASAEQFRRLCKVQVHILKPEP